MTDKALISDLTWRSLAMQREAFLDMPHFVAPDEIRQLLRPTTRNAKLKIHVVSYGVIADNRADLDEFIKLCKARKVEVVSKEDGTSWHSGQSAASLIDSWIAARRNGVAKRGGQARAVKLEKEFWEVFPKIADRWHLPAKKPNTNKHLLAEIKLSRNTVRSYLGYTREEWQRLTPAKRERILKRKAV